MGLDTQAKFGHTTFIKLQGVPSGVYGQVGPISALGARLPGVYGQVAGISTANAELPGVYSQVSAIGTSNAEAPAVYGQTTPTILAGVEQVVVYGQVVAISGFDEFTVFTSNINGAGDIIYYGDVGNLNLDAGGFSATMQNNVAMSGAAYPITGSTSLVVEESNSLMFSSAGTVALPLSEPGVYFLFSNHAGVAFSVSSTDPMVIASGSTTLLSLTGTGSHLGLIGDGTSWIAVEESGITS